MSKFSAGIFELSNKHVSNVKVPAVPLKEIAAPSFEVFVLASQTYPVGFVVAQKKAPWNLQLVKLAIRFASVLAA